MLEYLLGFEANHHYLALVAPDYCTRGYPPYDPQAIPRFESGNLDPVRQYFIISPLARVGTLQAWRTVTALYVATPLYMLTVAGRFQKHFTVRSKEVRLLEAWYAKDLIPEAWRVEVLHQTQVPTVAAWLVEHYPKDFQNAKHWSAVVCDELIALKMELRNAAAKCLTVFSGKELAMRLDTIYRLRGKLTLEQAARASLA
jgi:hypothetical protein